MQIVNETTLIETAGLERTTSFGFRASSVAFRVLSSGLYSDKIRAVLREVACNAADAHIAAGKPQQPIRIKLPTTLDSQFYIQDFGKGLADDAVQELFATYFSSSKTQDNALTGGFGLGSKSPFAYADQFQVESVHEGVHNTYLAFIAEDGQPAISLVGSMPAQPEWTSGMRIGFPVRAADNAEFERKAMAVLPWLSVPVTLCSARGVNILEPYEPKHRIELPSGTLLRFERNPGISILMGGVLYPVDPAKVEMPLEERLQMKALRQLDPCFQVPIGSVTPAASREALQYDELTRQRIRQLMNDAFKELQRHCHSTLGLDSMSSWAAAKEFKKQCSEVDELPANAHSRSAALDLTVQTLAALANIYDNSAALEEGSDLTRLLVDVANKVAHGTVQLPGWVGTAADPVRVRWLARASGVGAPTSVRLVREGAVGRKPKGSKLHLSLNSAVMYADAANALLRAHAALKQGDLANLILIEGRKTVTQDYAKRLVQALGGPALLSSSAFAPLDAVPARKSPSDRIREARNGCQVWVERPGSESEERMTVEQFLANYGTERFGIIVKTSRGRSARSIRYRLSPTQEVRDLHRYSSLVQQLASVTAQFDTPIQLPTLVMVDSMKDAVAAGLVNQFPYHGQELVKSIDEFVSDARGQAQLKNAAIPSSSVFAAVRRQLSGLRYVLATDEAARQWIVDNLDTEDPLRKIVELVPDVAEPVQEKSSAQEFCQIVRALARDVPSLESVAKRFPTDPNDQANEMVEAFRDHHPLSYAFDFSYGLLNQLKAEAPSKFNQLLALILLP